MSLGSAGSGLGDILRRHFPRSERIIRGIIQAVSFDRISKVQINEIDLKNIPILLKSKIRVIEQLFSSQTTVSGGFPEYLPALEPDGDKVKIYLHIDYIANVYEDWSGFDHDGNLEYLVTGTAPTTDESGPDLGNGFPSKSLDMPGGGLTCMTIRIANHTDFQIASLTSGFTIHVLFRADGLALDTGEARTLWASADDASNAMRLIVDPNGAVIFHVKKAGVTAKVKTANALINPLGSNYYDLVVTYNPTGPAIILYLAAGTYTTADATTINFNTTNFDGYIGGWGKTGSQRGYWNGAILHFMFASRIFSAAEAANLIANHWTSNTIGAGKKVSLTMFSLAKSP